jgi:O6-methylguanine-DNA--protein-cysteine methyltransferase
MAWSDYDSPLGRLTLVASERGLRQLHFPGRAPALDPCERDPESLRAFCEQLEEYFAGERETSDVALDLQATVFRRRVGRRCASCPTDT